MGLCWTAIFPFFSFYDSITPTYIGGRYITFLDSIIPTHIGGWVGGSRGMGSYRLVENRVVEIKKKRLIKK